MLKHQRDYVDVNHANNLVIQALTTEGLKKTAITENI